MVRRKNSKKAYDQNGRIKDEYALVLGGIRMGLLSAKGNFQSKNTKNGATRLRQINKSEENRNAYVDFYKKTMGEQKPKEEKLVLGQMKKTNNKIDVSKKVVKNKPKKMVLGNPRPRVRQPIKKLEAKIVRPKMSLGDDSKRTIDVRPEGLSKIGHDMMTSDNKKDKGYPHQELVDLVKKKKGIDFSKQYDECKKKNKINANQAVQKMNELIETNDILKYVKIINTKNDIRSLKEYYTLKTIVKIDKLNKEMEKRFGKKKEEPKASNLNAGLVVDLQKMFNMGNVDVDALKQLFENAGVFKSNTQEPLIQQNPPMANRNKNPTSDVKDADLKEYNDIQAGDDKVGVNIGDDFQKKKVKRWNVDGYFKQNANRQFSNLQGKKAQFKSGFRFRIKKEQKDKKRNLL